MSREFNITRDYYVKKEIMYKKSKFTINLGVTVLVGCNGSGKTTMMKVIQEQLDKLEIYNKYFDNLYDGGANARSKAGFLKDMDFLMSSLCSSEGENIFMNLGNVAQQIGYTLRKNNKDIKEYWILLDAVDSGLSVDNIIELKGLFDLIIDENKDKDIYIVVTANEYELARNEQCFDVYSCEYITFKDYEDYRKFIIKSGKIKQKRYDKNKKKDD